MTTGPLVIPPIPPGARRIPPAPKGEAAVNACRDILGWCGAYPIDAFPEPDLAECRKLLGDERMGALHAAWGRHILAGVARIAAQGLADAD